MVNYSKHFERENDAKFELDKWARLDRWLILGAEGGTYYASEKALTRENAKTILECLKEDGRRTVDRIQEISVAGRAPKNDPAIFALALAASDVDQKTREYALSMLPRVCRIGTHLFHFARDVQNFRGWGRGLREAVADWYLDKPIDKLTYDLLKYQSRDGWSHRDLIRLAHPKVLSGKEYNAALKWSVKGEYDKYTPSFLAAYEELKHSNEKQAIKLIETHGFTHEMIPSELKNSVKVWEALLQDMPMTAMIRNLGKMSQVGVFSSSWENIKKVVANLQDVDKIRKARVHPLNLLVANKTYSQGHGEKGKLSWGVHTEIVNALDEAFYASFATITPIGKNTLLALDVSGSMSYPNLAGMPITPREASAAMAMVTARTEPNWAVTGFSHQLVDIDIRPNMRLNEVIKLMDRLPFGATDCSLPMMEAAKHRVPIDVFAVYTDNETNSGRVPHKELKNFRQVMGRDAKLVVVGMTASNFTIADPNDAGMMDVVGFDSAAPALIADFVKGF